MTDEKHPLWQAKNGTKAECESANPVLLNGEIAVQTDTGKVAVGDGTRRYNTLDKTAMDSEVIHAEKLADKIYDGKDLAQVHANEIRNHASVWAWLNSRIQAGNFNGIHIGDYIPFQLSAGTITDGVSPITISAKTMYAQVAGIDTYYQYGWGIPANNNATKQSAHHIDFITTKTIGTTIQWNPTDNNNGTAENHSPWLASKIYAILNGINNESTNAFNNVKHGYNAESGGILQLLPQALQDVIKMKSLYLGNKYSASGLLTNHVGGADVWGIGKLWLPSEVEVYGTTIHSEEKASDGKNWNAYGTPVQYPLFAGSAGQRSNYWKDGTNWWLSSVCGGSSSFACFVNAGGYAGAYGCAATVSVPLCFRI